MASKTIIKTRKNIILYTIVEFFLIFFSYLIVFCFQKDATYSHIYTSLIILFWPIVSYVSNRYENIFSGEKLIDFIFKLIISSIAIIFIYSFSATLIDLLKIYREEYRIAYSYIFLTKILAINFIFCIFSKLILTRSTKKINNFKRWFYIGTDENLQTIYTNISTSKYSETIKIERIEKKEIDKIGNSKLIIDQEEQIEEFFYSLIDRSIEKIFKLYTILNWYEEIFEKIPIDFLKLENIYQIKKNSSQNNLTNKIKRVGDISLSSFILIITMPFSFLISISIWLEDKGPIFYSQNRVGLNGRIFKIYKFRSMIINAENNGVQWASKNDPRTTLVGQFLRKTRYDEIPQLFSVLKGEMSLIGPRPERPEIEKTLKNNIKFYNLKYLAKPGLSGWAQVNYPYGSSIEDSKNKLSFDLFYIKNKSIFLDFLILIKTLKVVCNFNRFGSN